MSFDYIWFNGNGLGLRLVLALLLPEQECHGYASVSRRCETTAVTPSRIDTP